MPTIPYFAYGSNISTKELNRKGVVPSYSQIALLRNHDIAFDVSVPRIPQLSGLATIFPKKGSCVYGVMHTVPDRSLIFLDLWELRILGLYRRSAVEIELDNSVSLLAQTYLSTSRKKTEKPTSVYQKKLIDGMTEFGMPKHWIMYIQSKMQNPFDQTD